MKVHPIVLAAGQGSRLRPHTDSRPKCLVELEGQSLLQRQAHTMAACGLPLPHVVVGYRASMIEALGFPTVMNPQHETTNMVWSLFCARHLFDGSHDVLVSYGDIVYEPRVLQAVLNSDGPIAVTVDRQWRRYWELRSPDPLSDAETLKLDAQGYLLELGKKPSGFADIEAQYIGLFKVHYSQAPAFLAAYDTLDRNGRFDGRSFEQMFMTSFLQGLIDGGWKLKAVPIDNGWLEVDTCEDLAIYQALAARGELDSYCHLA